MVLNKMVDYDFSDNKILVIGDLMLDVFKMGDTSRLSPEGPVPIVHVPLSEISYIPGGAANAGNNIRQLGGQVYITGVIGADANGKILHNRLTELGLNTDYIVVQESYPTITKERIYARGQQVCRVDHEDIHSVSQDSIIHMKKNLELIIPKVDIIVVSDYAKGVISKEIMDAIKKYGKRIIVDPRPQHRDLYHDVYMITPNVKEGKELCGYKENEEVSYKHIGIALRDELSANILLTRSEDGMSLFRKDNGIMEIPTEAKEVVDVTGAGDTVVAALALGIAAGYDLNDAAKLANKAAGIVVAKTGTSTVSVEELKKIC
jgi:D-glycero-beta-D-manno-heptose-7-phosphate kinase